MFFAAAGIYPSTALVLSWPAVNCSGATKRAVAGGLQITIGNLGAVIGTQLYRSAVSYATQHGQTALTDTFQDAPRFVRGNAVALGYLAANVAVAGTLWYLLNKENRKRDDALNAGALAQEDKETWKGDDDLRWRFTT